MSLNDDNNYLAWLKFFSVDLTKFFQLDKMSQVGRTRKPVIEPKSNVRPALKNNRSCQSRMLVPVWCYIRKKHDTLAIKLLYFFMFLFLGGCGVSTGMLIFCDFCLENTTFIQSTNKQPKWLIWRYFKNNPKGPAKDCGQKITRQLQQLWTDSPREDVVPDQSPPASPQYDAESLNSSSGTTCVPHCMFAVFITVPGANAEDKIS